MSTAGAMEDEESGKATNDSTLDLFAKVMRIELLQEYVTQNLTVLDLQHLKMAAWSTTDIQSSKILPFKYICFEKNSGKIRITATQMQNGVEFSYRLFETFSTMSQAWTKLKDLINHAGTIKFMRVDVDSALAVDITRAKIRETTGIFENCEFESREVANKCSQHLHTVYFGSEYPLRFIDDEFVTLLANRNVFYHGTGDEGCQLSDVLLDQNLTKSKLFCFPHVNTNFSIHGIVEFIKNAEIVSSKNWDFGIVKGRAALLEESLPACFTHSNEVEYGSRVFTIKKEDMLVCKLALRHI